jgi:VWFA-related protein
MKLVQSVFLISLLCLPALPWAQQGPSPAGVVGQSATQLPASLAPAPTPGNGERHINLDVVVTDRSGKPVQGLDMKDFTLRDNNQPAKILSVRVPDEAVATADPPVEVILLVDSVNVEIRNISFIRDQIEKFLLQNGGHLAQPVSLYVFTNQGLLTQHMPSSDGNGMAAMVKGLESRLRPIGQSAGVWGDVERFQLSIKTLTDIAENESKKPGRKLLIWCGPGWPLLDSPGFDFSRSGLQQYFNSIVKLSTKLREGHITVYSISMDDSVVREFPYQGFLKGVKASDKASPPHLALEVVALQSGGRVLGPNNDLAGQIETCVEDARAFYTLTFDPPRADHVNEYHDLAVQIDKPGLTARTSTGYYNQP